MKFRGFFMETAFAFLHENIFLKVDFFSSSKSIGFELSKPANKLTYFLLSAGLCNQMKNQVLTFLRSLSLELCFPSQPTVSMPCYTDHTHEKACSTLDLSSRDFPSPAGWHNSHCYLVVHAVGSNRVCHLGWSFQGDQGCLKHLLQLRVSMTLVVIKTLYE